MSISKRKSRLTEPDWLDSAGKDSRQMNFLDLLFDESGTEHGDQAEGREPKKQTRPEAVSVAQAKRQKKRA